MHDFEMAKDKVLMGPERRSMIISENDKRITAYHEAGHALVGKMMKGSDPVHKVTIIPRGRALGLTQQLPQEDRLNISKDGANDQITVAMGGRVAEELVFDQITTGASNDIQVATDLARKMVCDWGMSEKLGPLHFGKREGEVFLGRDFGDGGKDYSEQTAIEIDDEVRKIITANYDRARKAVSENMDKLKLLAEALLEFETIDGAEIDTIFAGGRLDRKPSTWATTSSPPKVVDKSKTEKRPAAPSIFAPARPLPDPEKA
jgi:cell division protease FtsH